jgi:hypothetical protein
MLYFPLMRQFLESLSLTSGAIVVAVASTALVWVLTFLLPKLPRWIWAVVVPFGLAYCLYWSPVWLGADSSEYSAWAFLGVGGWFFAGFFPSAFLVRILEKRASK